MLWFAPVPLLYALRGDAQVAPAQSQGFALVGALFIVPFILMYTA